MLCGVCGVCGTVTLFSAVGLEGAFVLEGLVEGLEQDGFCKEKGRQEQKKVSARRDEAIGADQPTGWVAQFKGFCAHQPITFEDKVVKYDQRNERKKSHECGKDLSWQEELGQDHQQKGEVKGCLAQALCTAERSIKACMKEQAPDAQGKKGQCGDPPRRKMSKGIHKKAEWNQHDPTQKLRRHVDLACIKPQTKPKQRKDHQAGQ